LGAVSLSELHWEQPEFSPGGWKGGAEQAAEKPANAVILSEAKDLALSAFKAMRDSSSPAAPQNDSVCEFFPQPEKPRPSGGVQMW
jgi:hypothetical protein